MSTSDPTAKIGPARHWNSWNSERPAEMTFLPLGFRITPLAYAGSTNEATRFPPGPRVRFGPRTIDGDALSLDLKHAGTRIPWRVTKTDPLSVHGAWRAETFGEWGLRFWVILAISVDTGDLVRFDPKKTRVTAQIARSHVALTTDPPPYLVTVHENLDALETELEAHGYFYLASRGTEGPVVALRFNLEDAGGARFFATVADSEDAADARLEQLISLPRPQDTAPALASDTPAGALDAIRDVIGWNTVWDPINRRPYTALSRFWIAHKFGGFGVWQNDVLFHALMAGLTDADIATENLEAVFSAQTPEGNIPCLMTGNDSWVDRSQPPVGAYVVWCLAQRGAPELIARWYPVLRRAYDWWWRARDPAGTGLVSLGTSPVGTGLYRGTKLAAKNESCMDNSPVHDEAPFDPETGLMGVAEVGLNSQLALEGEVLAMMARSLGLDEDARVLESRTKAHRAAIQTTLWDPERQVFANRRRDGAFIRSLTPTSFYPLLAGAATDEQADALCGLYLDTPNKFGGPVGLPSVTRDDPAYTDNIYWRGRVWPPMNFLTVLGLRRYGRHDHADRLTAISADIFESNWRDRICGENFSAETGQALDQPDTDGFYGWGALLPLAVVCQVMDVSPWDGWSVARPGGEGTIFGPVRSPVGLVTVRNEGETWGLYRGETVLMQTNLDGRITQIRMGNGQADLRLPSTVGDGAWIGFPSLGRVSARSDGAPIEVDSHGHINLSPSDSNRRLIVVGSI